MRPVLPDEFLGVVKHVEDVHLFWHFQPEDYRGELVIWVQAKRREQVWGASVEMHVEIAELLAAGFLHRHSKGPNAAESSEIGQDFFNLLGYFCIFLIVHLEVGTQDAEVGVDKGHF